MLLLKQIKKLFFYKFFFYRFSNSNKIIYLKKIKTKLI